MLNSVPGKTVAENNDQIVIFYISNQQFVTIQWNSFFIENQYNGILEQPQKQTIEPKNLKWNFRLDGAARGKPGPAGIEGDLCEGKGDSRIAFSGTIGIRGSNKAEIWVTSEILRLFTASFTGLFTADIAIWWPSNRAFPLEYHFILNDLKIIPESLDMVFYYTLRKPIVWQTLS